MEEARFRLIDPVVRYVPAFAGVKVLEPDGSDGVRYLSRKTLALMDSNHVPLALLPLELSGFPIPGCGFGRGSRVVSDVVQTGVPGSLGEFGWAGAAKTYYWVDPWEQIVDIFMTQSMSSFDLSQMDLRALAYPAIID